MTCALIPLLRKSDLRSVVIIASIAGLANQRYVSEIFPAWQYDANFELTPEQWEVFLTVSPR